MSEPVTIWEKREGEPNWLRFHPNYGTSDPEARMLTEYQMNELRRAKRLTNAECAAEYWASEYEIDHFRGQYARASTLHRFAVNDQAV